MENFDFGGDEFMIGDCQDDHISQDMGEGFEQADLQGELVEDWRKTIYEFHSENVMDFINALNRPRNIHHNDLIFDFDDDDFNMEQGDF